MTVPSTRKNLPLRRWARARPTVVLFGRGEEAVQWGPTGPGRARALLAADAGLDYPSALTAIPVATALEQARMINLMDNMRMDGDRQPVEAFLGRTIPEVGHPKR